MTEDVGPSPGAVPPSEAGPSPGAVPPASDRPSRPAPLPVGTPLTRPPESRSRVVVLAIAAVVAFLALACACCTYAPRALAPITAPYAEKAGRGFIERLGPRMWTGRQALYWSDGGRYAVAQVPEMRMTGNTTTVRGTVVVHDLETSSTRVLPDYTVVAVEPHSPRLWLRHSPPGPLALDSDVASGAPSVDQAWDAVYATGTPAVVWDLSRPATTTESAGTTWAPWPGPAGVVAQVEVATDTAAAVGVRFASAGEGSRSVAATLSGAFEPLGWCPDGRHFAMVSLQRIQEFTQPPLDTPLQDVGTASRNRVYLIDTETGAPSAVQGIGYVVGDLRRKVMWDARSEHTLLCLVESLVRDGDGFARKRNVSVATPAASPAVRWLFSDPGSPGIEWPWEHDPMWFVGRGATASYVIATSDAGPTFWTLDTRSTAASLPVATVGTSTAWSDAIVSPRSDVLAFSYGEYRPGSPEMGSIVVATKDGVRTIHTMRIEGMPDYSGLLGLFLPDSVKGD